MAIVFVSACALVLDIDVEHVSLATGGAAGSTTAGGNGGMGGAGGECGRGGFAEPTIACVDQPCNCLALPAGPPVEHVHKPGDPPPFTGGPTPAGLFELREVTLYTGQTGAGGEAPTGKTQRETARWKAGSATSAASVDTVSETTNQNGTLLERFNATAEPKGHSVTLLGSCCAPPVKPAEFSYESSTGTLRLGFPGTNGLQVQTYLRVGP